MNTSILADSAREYGENSVSHAVHHTLLQNTFMLHYCKMTGKIYLERKKSLLHFLQEKGLQHLLQEKDY
jgi:hypothetical protein